MIYTTVQLKRGERASVRRERRVGPRILRRSDGKTLCSGCRRYDWGRIFW